MEEVVGVNLRCHYGTTRLQGGQEVRARQLHLRRFCPGIVGGSSIDDETLLVVALRDSEGAVDDLRGGGETDHIRCSHSTDQLDILAVKSVDRWARGDTRGGAKELGGERGVLGLE